MGPEGRAFQQRGWHDQKHKAGMQEACIDSDKWICCTLEGVWKSHGRQEKKVRVSGPKEEASA